MLSSELMYFTIALLSSLAFCQFLARTTTSELFWESTDYIWYGIGVFGVVVFFIDYKETSHLSQLRAYEQNIEDNFNIMGGMLGSYLEKNCADNPTPLCWYSMEFLETLANFENSSAWPTGAIKYNGQAFENVNILMKSIAEKHGVSAFEGETSVVMMHSTMNMDRMAEYRILKEEEPLSMPAGYLRVASYLLAFGVALRLGKVTAKIIRLCR